jgi:hypothetical protein
MKNLAVNWSNDGVLACDRIFTRHGVCPRCKRVRIVSISPHHDDDSDVGRLSILTNKMTQMHKLLVKTALCSQLGHFHGDRTDCHVEMILRCVTQPVSLEA